jgi:hypothetical protein
VDLLHKSVDLVDGWLKDQGTDEQLRKMLMEYAHGRGGKTMSEIVGWKGGQWRRLADSMDVIGWRRFMEGMVSKEVAQIQRKVDHGGKFRISVDAWCAGLVTRLLEVTHGQWLYRNVHVHDLFSGERAMNRKEALRKEIEYQIALGGDGLAEEDQYLLEINLDDLQLSSGEDQVYWLMALQTARKAWQIREARANRTAAEEED